MADFVIAVDFGGTHLRAALVDASGQVVEHVKRRTEATRGPEVVFTNLARAITDVAGKAPPETLLGVGVAAPGPVDQIRGTIHDPPNLPGWGVVPLAQILSERADIPVALGNDANLAALGEHTFGAGVGYSEMIYLTISTGIGGGVITHDHLLLGQRGLAAELGHMLIVPDGPQCGCGLRGHLEALGSGPAIARRMAGLLRAGFPSSVQAVDGIIGTEQIVVAAREGDALSIRILEEAGTFIGMGIATLVHTFAPQRFVIGGGVSNAGDLLLEPMRQAANERVLEAYRGAYDIVLAALGDDAGLLGAAALAFKTFGPAADTVLRGT
ncbi:MAG TPA: hypothetical protein DEP84_15740 [Chloroflexi bacterium]|nr:hypothetical protein [Chloroflexota bacterium]